MLSEQRYAMILKILEQRNSVTVAELTDLLHISESTARRDIAALDKAGRLSKVFGGALRLDGVFSPSEPTVVQKAEVMQDEKRRIAKYAASLVSPRDFVYLDAGTTTGFMIEFFAEVTAAFVTNAVAHAQRLAALGRQVILIGGTLKGTTEAVVGGTAALMLKEYHFTKGFFGTNGVSKASGFTTPDASEALVKKTALSQCGRAFVLCDHSKFNLISSVTFANFAAATVITDQCPSEFSDHVLIASE